MAQRGSPEEGTRRRAAEFVVGDETPSREDEQQLLRWLSDSPKNVSEYLQASAVWEALAEPELLRLESAGTTRRLPGGRWRAAALALAASLALVAGWVAWRGREIATYSTEMGEVASFQLDDRSVVFMNADSELSVEYTEQRRRLVLHSGEASFEVSEDPLRPFVVESASTRVIAIGTEFVVRRDPARTTVTVLEGRVLVEGDFEPPEGLDSPISATPGVPARGTALGPRQRLEVEDSHRASLTTVETRDAASWRQRRLVFDAERLEAVAAEFNRFNSNAIQIDDPELKELRISGVFEANDPESLLTFLHSNAGADIRFEADGTARVGRGRASPR